MRATWKLVCPTSTTVSETPSSVTDPLLTM
jgi:hypothetical protein